MSNYEVDLMELELFWNWLVKDYPKQAFTEIRLMSIKNDKVYNQVKLFSEQVHDCNMRKNSQFFIQSFEQLKEIVLFNDCFFMKNSKVCYSLNPRFFVGDDISGGYDNLLFQNKIYLDIEKSNHEPLKDDERKLILGYCKDIYIYLNRYELFSPTVISSGNGMHIIYRVLPSKINEGLKETYKDFINHLKDKFDGLLFHIDSVVDMTRTTALPETLNPKNGFKVHTIVIGKDNFFKFRAKAIKKNKVVVNSEDVGDVKNSLVYKLLTTPGLPEGDRNGVLVYYLKMLIRDFGVDYREYEREIRTIQREQWKMNPLQGINGKIRNFGLVVNWCKRNKEWCEENNINIKDYKY